MDNAGGCVSCSKLSNMPKSSHSHRSYEMLKSVLPFDLILSMPQLGYMIRQLPPLVAVLWCRVTHKINTGVNEPAGRPVAHGTHHRAGWKQCQRMLHCLSHRAKEEGCYRAHQEGCNAKSSLGLLDQHSRRFQRLKCLSGRQSDQNHTAL